MSGYNHCIFVLLFCCQQFCN
uniref:Uncharacterized protein n=1 Tax=Arundo donax TaxID=35708 RepID=A0A0A9B781_ARUDO